MNRHKDWHHLELDAKLRDLDRQLREACRVTPPAGLTERVFTSTVDQLPQPGVLGRLGPIAAWAGRAAAVAAVLALLIFGMQRIEPLPVEPAATVASGDALTPAVTRDLRAMELAMEGPSTSIDAEIASLSMEVDALTVTMHMPSYEQDPDLDPWLPQDLTQLEAQTWAF